MIVLLSSTKVYTYSDDGTLLNSETPAGGSLSDLYVSSDGYIFILASSGTIFKYNSSLELQTSTSVSFVNAYAIEGNDDYIYCCGLNLNNSSVYRLPHSLASSTGFGLDSGAVYALDLDVTASNEIFVTYNSDGLYKYNSSLTSDWNKSGTLNRCQVINTDDVITCDTSDGKMYYYYNDGTAGGNFDPTGNFISVTPQAEIEVSSSGTIFQFTLNSPTDGYLNTYTYDTGTDTFTEVTSDAWTSTTGNFLPAVLAQDEGYVAGNIEVGGGE